MFAEPDSFGAVIVTAGWIVTQRLTEIMIGLPRRDTLSGHPSGAHPPL